MAARGISSGCLDGLTILRYAHAFDTGGGVEQHLADLNGELSRRNKLTTIQMHLTSDASRLAETEECIGRSRLIKVPLFVAESPSAGEAASPGGMTVLRKRLQAAALNLLLFSPKLNAGFVRSVLRWRKIPVRRGEPVGAGMKSAKLFQRFKVDLVVLHTSGGADASEVLCAARQSGVPVVLVHHFSNDRLGGMSMRQQTMLAEAVGGASLVGVPAYLGKRFTNLSDAVDLEFYHPRNACPLPQRVPVPVLYAPGRITPDKGQMDVVKVASLLKQRGLPTTVVFAGRVDCPKFEASLRAAVAKEGLTGSVEFIGQLSREQYRDGFGAAYMTLMPTYHHEGMPRTLIDSQAMKAPPIVYDIGGTREGVKHLETGFLVRLGDVNAVAQAAEILLRDANLRAKMAEAGRRFVEHQFSLNAFAGRHERFYLAALKPAPYVRNRAGRP
jgi:glycosyltransferase involved in cell wall biosynthesis